MASRDALNLLKQRQIAATSSRQAAEVRAATAMAGNVQGRVIATDQDGTTVRTSNGGDILVDNIGGRTPADGSVVQLSTSTAGGKAELNTQERSQETAEALGTSQPVRALFRAPTADDVGVNGEVWIHLRGSISAGYDVAGFHIYSSVNGRFVPVSGHEELNGYIESPTQGQPYPIIPSAFYTSTVASIHIRVGAASTTVTTNGASTAVAGGTSVQLNYAIGATVTTGDRVTLTPTATDGTALEFTIGFLR